MTHLCRWVKGMQWLLLNIPNVVLVQQEYPRYHQVLVSHTLLSDAEKEFKIRNILRATAVL